MKNLILLSVFAVASAQAHIEKGTWKGVVRDGVACFMDVGPQTFKDGLQHPLNERIEIKIGSTTYSVQHPYSINVETGEVGFNHDLFEGVEATKTGAFAVQIKMIRTEEFEGPGSFSVMEHNWKTGAKELVECESLKKVD